MKKIAILILMVFATFSLVACGGSASDAFQQGMKDAMTEGTKESEEKETEPQESEEKETESQKPEEKEAEPQEQETTAEAEPEEKAEPAVNQENQEATPEAEETGNPLMDAEVSVGDVMNGFKTEKLGEWAEVQVDKDTMKSITPEKFSEFCNTRVKDSGYNWYTINCGDGTGIVFAGSVSYVATYGTIDDEGCIVKSSGTIMIQEDGTYSYTEAE